MHYKNGREAKENDNVLVPGWLPSGNGVLAGRIHSLNAQSDTCNGQVASAVVGGMTSVSVNVKDCVHAEDAMIAFMATHKEPAT